MNLVIVPAYNEAPVITQVIKGLKKELRPLGKFDILVIDDGSSDETGKKAQQAQVKVVRHLLNRGLGGALSTGLAYARRHGYNLAVTFDADGQHHPQDIASVIEPILKKQADVVIGSRLKSPQGQMPVDRRLINWLSNIITLLMFGIYTTDSQSGFRAFSRKAINKIDIRTEGMEVSSEIFSEIKKHHLKLAEVPIRVIYTDYSRSKGQSNLNAVNVLFKLLLRLVR